MDVSTDYMRMSIAEFGGLYTSTCKIIFEKTTKERTSKRILKRNEGNIGKVEENIYIYIYNI